MKRKVRSRSATIYLEGGRGPDPLEKAVGAGSTPAKYLRPAELGGGVQVPGGHLAEVVRNAMALTKMHVGYAAAFAAIVGTASGGAQAPTPAAVAHRVLLIPRVL